MKKILFLLFLLPLLSQAQFPNTINSGNAFTHQKTPGAFGAMLGYVFAGSYGDTTAANLSFIKNVPGIVIRNIDTLWQRNNTATKWIKIGAGSIPNLQQVTDVGSITTNGITAPSFGDQTGLFLLTTTGVGDLQLSSGTGVDHLMPQAVSTGNNFRLPNTGHLADTLATLSDVRAGGISGITADNGLTASTSTNVQLGGTFTKKDTLNTSTTYDLTITGSTTGQVLNVYNTNVSSGVAIYAVSTAGGGIYGISSGGGEGVVAQSVSGFGVSAQSQSGVPGIFFALPSSTNTIAPVLSISRGSSGTAADGIGSSIDFYNKTSGTPGQPISNQLISKWTTSDNATRTSQFDITGVNSGTDETFMNIQHDLVRINNNADTLATKAYARSVGGGGGGAVTSVSNSDGTLIISPTTGNVIGSLNLSHANTWIGKQTFNGYINVTGDNYPNKLIDFGGYGYFTTEASTHGFAFVNAVSGVSGFFTSGATRVFSFDDAGNSNFGPTGPGSFKLRVEGSLGTESLNLINSPAAYSAGGYDILARNQTTGDVESVTVSGGADPLGTYIVQTATNAPANAQALASLGTGIVKNTTATGVLSIAAAGDFPTLNQNTTGSAATLTTTRTIWGQNFNGSANVTGDLALGASNLTMTGSIASTGSRVTKGWFTDGEFTNMPTVGGTSLSSTFQASDADLTTWAGITPGANVGTFLATPSSANLRSALTDENGTGVALFNGATSPDFTTSVTVGSVAVPTISSTNTLTNKRITKRTGTVASSATPTINTDNVDIFTITAQTVDITSMSTNLSGTPVTGDEIDIWITGTASRAITWGASFVATSIALPTTTSGTATLKVKFTYNGSAWAIDGYR